MNKPSGNIVFEAVDEIEFERLVQDYASHSTHGFDLEAARLEVMKARQSGKRFIIDGEELEFV